MGSPRALRTPRLPALLALLALLALAATVRPDLNTSGIPGRIFERHDEVHYVEPAMRFLRGDWHVDSFVNPTLYTYLLTGVTQLVGLGLIAAGKFGSYSEFVLETTLDPYLITIVGRSITLALSLASVVLIYLVGKRVSSARVGLVAAAALALNRTHVDSGALVGNECLMVGLLLALLLALLRHIERPTSGSHALCGLLLGLAASTKYSAGIHVLTLLAATLAVALRRPRDAGLLRELARPVCWIGFVCAAAGFLLGSPYVLIEPAEFAADFELQASFLHEGYSQRDVLLNRLGWVTYAKRFPHDNNGTIFALLCGLGVVLALGRAVRRRETPFVLLLCASLPAYLYLGSGIFSRMRFLLVATPFFVVLGAWALDGLAQALLHTARRKRPTADPPGRSWSAATSLVLAALVLAPSGWRTATDIDTAYLRDVRVRGVLLTWILDNLDPKERYLDLCTPAIYRSFATPPAVVKRGLRERDLETPAERQRLRQFRSRYFRSRLLTAVLAKAEDMAAFRELLAERKETALIVSMALRGIDRRMPAREILSRALENLPKRGARGRTTCGYWDEVQAFLLELEVVGLRVVGDSFVCVLKLP